MVFLREDDVDGEKDLVQGFQFQDMAIAHFRDANSVHDKVSFSSRLGTVTLLHRPIRTQKRKKLTGHVLAV